MNDNFGYTASRKRRMAEVLKQVGLSNLVDLLDEERYSLQSVNFFPLS